MNKVAGSCEILESYNSQQTHYLRKYFVSVKFCQPKFYSRPLETITFIYYIVIIMLLAHINFLFCLLVFTALVNGSNGLGKGCDNANVLCLKQATNMFALRRDIGDRKLTSSLHWWNFFSKCY